MFWRCDRTYIWEKVANYSKCPQTSPYARFCFSDVEKTPEWKASGESLAAQVD